MDPILGEIKIFPLSYAPVGWLPCDGRVMPISGNQALYSLLGIYYGGDGKTTFNLPDLRGRVPIQMSGGNYGLGVASGSETVSLTRGQLNPHNHAVAAVDSPATVPSGLNALVAQSLDNAHAPLNLYSNAALTSSNTVPLAAATVSSIGGNSGHANMQPFQVLGYCIAVQGVYPMRP